MCFICSSYSWSCTPHLVCFYWIPERLLHNHLFSFWLLFSSITIGLARLHLILCYFIIWHLYNHPLLYRLSMISILHLSANLQKCMGRSTVKNFMECRCHWVQDLTVKQVIHERTICLVTDDFVDTFSTTRTCCVFLIFPFCIVLFLYGSPHFNDCDPCWHSAARRCWTISAGHHVIEMFALNQMSLLSFMDISPSVRHCMLQVR